MYIDSERLLAGIFCILDESGGTAGTGFAVTQSGWVVTCAHVVRNAGASPGDTVRLTFRLTGQEIAARVLEKYWFEKDREDIAILKLAEPFPKHIQPLLLSSSVNLAGHSFDTFGFPKVQGLKGMWAEGTISNRTQDTGDFPLLQLTNASEITEGFSGAPVIDRKTQRVVGMITSYPPSTEGRRTKTAFATPSNLIQQICPEIKFSAICPYMGLAAFTEQDTNFFFGREELVAKMIANLRQFPCFLGLVGASGSGKSSVAQAGLLPELRQGKVAGFQNIRIIQLRPSNSPRISLLKSLPITRNLVPESEIFWDQIQCYFQTSKHRTVIFVDQFEEIFTLCSMQEQRDFIEGLLKLLQSSLQVTLILTIRTDFYALLQESCLGQLLDAGVINVRGVLDKEDLRGIITKPAEKVGLNLESILINEILRDLESIKSPLPLLEFILKQLWEIEHNNNILTYDLYLKMGKVTGVITQWADQVFRSLSLEEKELARCILVRLIRYGSTDTPDTRRYLPLKELINSNGDFTHKLINKLVNAHLIIVRNIDNTHDSSSSTVVEIIHDVLIEEWADLRKWIEEEREFRLWQQSLEENLRKWKSQNETESYLLYAAPLAVAETWLIKRKSALTQIEKKYIGQSIEKRERLKKRTISLLTGGLLAVSFLAMIAGIGWQQAEQARQQAEWQRQQTFVRELSAQAQLTQNEENNLLERSILLAIEAKKRGMKIGVQSLQADQALRSGMKLLLKPKIRLVLPSNSPCCRLPIFSEDSKRIITVTDNIRVSEISNGADTLHFDQGKNFVLSPNGKYLATWEKGKIIRIFLLEKNKEVAQLPYEDSENYLAPIRFSEGNKYLLVNKKDRSQLQRIDEYGDIKSTNLSFLKKRIGAYSFSNSLFFSPNDEYIVEPNKGSWTVWKTSDASKILSLPGANETVSRTGEIATFSSDGKYLAGTVSEGIKIWELPTGREVAFVKANSWILTAMKLSHDGKYLAIGNRGGGVVVFDILEGVKEVSSIRHSSEWVKFLNFSPDGQYLAMGGGNVEKIIRFIKLPAGEEIARVIDEKFNSLYKAGGVTFSPDGRYIAGYQPSPTEKNNYIFSIWNMPSNSEVTPFLSEEELIYLKFSPDGKYVALILKNKNVKIHDLERNQVILSFDHSEYNTFDSFLFSANSKYLAVGDIKVFDLEDKREIISKAWQTVDDRAFSSDNRYLIAMQTGGRITNADTGEEFSVESGKIIIDLQTGQETFTKLESQVVEVLSPHGTYIAYVSDDEVSHINNETPVGDVKHRILTLKSSTSGEVIQKIKFSLDRTQNVKIKFSPDEKLVAVFGGHSMASATETSNGIIRAWNVISGEKIADFSLQRLVSNISFSFDNKLLAAVVADGSIRVWDIASEQQEIIRIEKAVEGAWRSSYITFSPDGKYLTAGNYYHSATTWLLKAEDQITEACNRLTRNLTPEEWKRHFLQEEYQKTCPNLP